MAVDDHISQAIEHTNQAIDDGKHGRADGVVTHAEAALTHAETSEKVKARCLIPGFDGAFLSHESKDALWDKFYTAAPQRRRQSVERYTIVKRA